MTFYDPPSIAVPKHILLVQRSASSVDEIYEMTGDRVVRSRRLAGMAGVPILQVLAWLAAGLILLGIVMGIFTPGKLTGVILPIGLTLWWLVGLMANKSASGSAG